MAVVVRCASCRRQINVPDRLAGHRVTCPRCGKAAPVPLPEVPAETPPPTAHPDDVLEVLPRFGRLGVVSLGLGLLSVVVVCVPVVGYASLVLSGLGLLLGLCALLDFARGRFGGHGLRTNAGAQVMCQPDARALHYALAGTGVSMLALVLTLLPLLLHR
jgi:hypothetical protein